jgi:hypothetical protein
MSKKSDDARSAAIEVIRASAAKYGSTYISRDKVEDFTGGAIRARNIANLDSLGQGPRGAFKLGRRQCYPVENLIEWLLSRLEVNK